MALIALAGCVRPDTIRHTPKTYTSEEQKRMLIGYEPADTVAKARANLRNYEAAYMEQANARVRARNGGSDVSAFGGIVGAASGLTKSPETAIAGLLLGAGGTYGEQRYRMSVQATNFERAAASMRCLGNVLTPDPRPEAMTSDGPLEAGVARLANTHIDVVIARLIAAQRAIEPAAVDIDAVRAAVQQQLDAAGAKQAIDKLRSGERLLQQEADREAARAAVLKVVQAEMALCTAA